MPVKRLNLCLGQGQYVIDPEYCNNISTAKGLALAVLDIAISIKYVEEATFEGLSEIKLVAPDERSGDDEDLIEQEAVVLALALSLSDILPQKSMDEVVQSLGEKCCEDLNVPAIAIELLDGRGLQKIYTKKPKRLQ